MSIIQRFTQLDFKNHVNDGLIACWPINEQSNDNAFDISHRNNKGVLTNTPTWSYAKSGSVLTLDSGSSQYINIASDPEFAIGTGDFTASIWIRTTLGDGVYVVFGHFSSWWIGWIDQVTTLNVAGSDVTESSLSSNDGDWHLLTGVRRSGTIYLYIDGIEQSSGAGAGSITAGQISIGQFGDFGDFYFPGDVSETRLYNRALSHSEIIELYLRPPDIYARDPIELWSFVASAGDDMTLSDGFEVSDSLAMSASAPASMSDGFEFSDSASLTASVSMSMSDTAVFSDSASLVASGNMSLSDGVVFSDSFSNTASALMGLADGFEFSDSMQSVAALLMSLSDTAVFSDVVSFQSGNFMNLADGFEFSDALSLDKGALTLTLSDGFTFSDALTAVSSAVMGLEDGFVLSDSVSLNTGALVEGPVTISVQVKQAKFDITIKKQDFSVSTKQPKFDTEVN